MPARGTVPQPANSRGSRLLPPTRWTSEPVGPPELGQIVPAGFVGCEPSLEFSEIPRKIFHGAEHHMVGSLESRDRKSVV